MPDLALALLALAPPGESGVWLDTPPKPGTVVTRPLDVAGETQALEGVRTVELWVVRDGRSRLVETYQPTLPLGTIPFVFTFDPKGTLPGRVTIRVVATTALRGFSAEIPGLVVPAPRTVRPSDVRPVVPVPRAAGPVAPAPVVRPAARAPRYDDSGRAFGRAAPLLPYRPAPSPAPPERRAVTPAAAPLPPHRSGWLSVAAGLLLLVTSAHLHRALRKHPLEGESR